MDPAISDFIAGFEVTIMKEDPKTGMNRLCIENGLLSPLKGDWPFNRCIVRQNVMKIL